jgi:phosphatidylserine/phosphatidylglycerophosphate/cardiolipin synthase-like enzyme
MSPIQDLDALLLQTLQDQTLSRSERKHLKDLLAHSERGEEHARVLRQRAFALARQHHATTGATAILEWLEDVTQTAAQLAHPNTTEPVAEALFSPGDTCRNRIAALLDQTRHTADLAVFTITDDHITHAITAAHRRGVHLRILTDNDKSEDRGSDIDRLARAGIPVRQDDTPAHMHHKFALFDQRLLLTGSYNWTRSAFLENSENVVVVEEPRLVRRFTDEFERLWAAFAT